MENKYSVINAIRRMRRRDATTPPNDVEAAARFANRHRQSPAPPSPPPLPQTPANEAYDTTPPITMIRQTTDNNTSCEEKRRRDATTLLNDDADAARSANRHSQPPPPPSPPPVETPANDAHDTIPPINVITMIRQTVVNNASCDGKTRRDATTSPVNDVDAARSANNRHSQPPTAPAPPPLQTSANEAHDTTPSINVIAISPTTDSTCEGKRRRDVTTPLNDADAARSTNRHLQSPPQTSANEARALQTSPITPPSNFNVDRSTTATTTDIIMHEPGREESTPLDRHVLASRRMLAKISTRERYAPATSNLKTMWHYNVEEDEEEDWGFKKSYFYNNDDFYTRYR